MVWHAAKTACRAGSARGRRSSKPAVAVILQITRTQNAAHSFGSGDATINALLRTRTSNSRLVYIYAVQNLSSGVNKRRPNRQPVAKTAITISECGIFSFH